MVATGTPKRGDVIVFRLPPNPKINYIKRLIGLPGDLIRVDEKNQLYVNDKPVPQEPGPTYMGPKQDLYNYEGAPTAFEQLDANRHRIMFAKGGVKTGEWRYPQGNTFSWATTATTARTVGLPTIWMHPASCRSRI